MKDPRFSVLESLDALFHYEPTRNGKYIYPEVQKLKESVEHYTQQPTKSHFMPLVKAIAQALSYINKWDLDFKNITLILDAEAHSYGLPPINWQKLLSHSPGSPSFQFSKLNHAAPSNNLLQWLAKKSPVPISKIELTQLLLDNKDEGGFSKKLNDHLKKEPNFLFHLIIESEDCFTKIADSLLILYLTDEQLAKAILNHLPSEDEQSPMSFEIVDSIVEKLNKTLSHGRSISTLLRNAHAKAILDSSVVFQTYQSTAYTERSTNALESIEPVKPSIGYDI
ncbi:MAG: hypothetical protein CK426_06430 [Legionella sp.]|nr:MAG: hypothetical protein CK423_05925 [Legionella sp.]PJD98415.1 MAG: hypothetical protein CK426_06430 [Legionella sp.]